MKTMIHIDEAWLRQHLRRRDVEAWLHMRPASEVFHVCMDESVSYCNGIMKFNGSLEGRELNDFHNYTGHTQPPKRQVVAEEENGIYVRSDEIGVDNWTEEEHD